MCTISDVNLSNLFKYSNFTLLGFKETDNQGMHAIPIIGIEKNTPVAAIVEDSIIREIQEALPQEGAFSIAVVPFILAVVAIDAGLIATMWAVAMSR